MKITDRIKEQKGVAETLDAPVRGFQGSLRKPMTTNLLFALALGAFLNLPVSAATVSQTVPVSFSESGTTAKNGKVGDFFLATGLQPFDSALGTLSSLEFSWVMTLTGSATTDETASDSNYQVIQGRANGPYFIGSSLYAGNGGSGGSGSDTPGTALFFSFNVANDTIFLVADAGVTYNDHILGLVTGASTFSADWSTYYRFQAPAIPWTAEANGSLTVTYDFEAAPAPEPSTFAMLSAVLLAGIVLSRRRTAWPIRMSRQ